MSSYPDFLNSGSSLLENLGDFWTKVYRGGVPAGKDPPLVSYGNGLVSAFRDNWDFIQLAEQGLSLSNIDFKKSVSALAITIWESKMQTCQAIIGGTTVTGYGFSWSDCDLAEGWKDKNFGRWTIASARKVVSKLDETGIVWQENTDFVIDDEAERIVFASNPFAAGSPWSSLIKTKVLPNFQQSRYLRIFLKDITYYTSDPLRMLLPAFGKSFIENLTHPRIANQYLKIAGNAILYGATQSVLENVLDLAFPGKSARAWQAWNSYQYNSIDLPSLTIPKPVLGSSYSGGLTFSNSTQPTDTSGGQFKFPITGNSSDVTLFWNTVHSGTVNGRSWPQLVSDYYGSLPSSVNPMKFICQHILRNAWKIVKIDTAAVRKSEAVTSIGNFFSQFWPKNLGVLLVLVSGSSQNTFLGSDPQCGVQIAASL